MFKKFQSAGAAVIIALGVYGCSLSDTPTSPVSASSDANNSLLGSLTNGLVGTVTNLTNSLILRCDELPKQSVSQVIGKNGGRINVGPHTLTIPSGALTRDTKITAIIPGDKSVSVQFYPEGLQFKKQASLTLSYGHCTTLLPLPVQVVYTTDDLKILELLKSTDDRRNKKVSAPLKHFSTYAAAWRGGSTDDLAEEENLDDSIDGGGRCCRGDDAR